MGGGGAGPRKLAAAALALWLMPAVLALAPLWLPPLCCAVAAVRFRRARSELAARRSSRGRGCGGGGERARDEEEDGEDGRDSASRLLHRYLDDQVELVLVGGGLSGEDRAPDP